MICPALRLSALRRALPAVLLLVGACAGEDARDHVFVSRPPAPVVRPSPPAPPVPERPLGAAGPTAKIESVRLVSTGAPVSLGEVRESFELLVVVSRGRGTSPMEAARAELRLTGAVDTTLVTPFEPPVPLVIALPFRVPVGASGGLRAGRYAAQVRLIGAAGRVLAASAPLALSVRP
jgi:hypothetical protein